MEIFKKLAVACLSGVLILSLAACGPKDPTAQDLISGIGQADPGKLQDLSVTLEAHATADAIAENEELGLSGSVDMSVSMGVAACGDVAHIYDLNLSMGMGGFDMSFTGEAWSDRTAGASYMRMAAFGQDSGWEKTALGGASGSGVDLDGLSGLTDGMAALWDGGFEFTMQDRGKKDDYVLTWSVPAAMLAELMGEAGMDGPDTAAMPDFDAKAVFDYGTHVIKSAEASGSADGSDVVIRITFNAWNQDGSLSVPQDVIDSAVDADLSDSLPNGLDGLGPDGLFGGDGGDDGFSYDEYNGDGVLDGDLTGYGEWANMNSDDSFWSDRAGTDPAIDGLGDTLNSTLDWETYPDDLVRLWHMDDYSELDFAHRPENWSGDLEIRHFYAVNGEAEYLSSMKSTYASFYPDDDPYFMNATEVLYLHDGSLELCRILSDKGIAVTAGIYDYTGEASDEAMLGWLSELLSLAGFQS